MTRARPRHTRRDRSGLLLLFEKAAPTQKPAAMACCPTTPPGSTARRGARGCAALPLRGSLGDMRAQAKQGGWPPRRPHRTVRGPGLLHLRKPRRREADSGGNPLWPLEQERPAAWLPGAGIFGGGMKGHEDIHRPITGLWVGLWPSMLTQSNRCSQTQKRLRR
jgi:hypothetical protein